LREPWHALAGAPRLDQEPSRIPDFRPFHASVLAFLLPLDYRSVSQSAIVQN
jgi:hypothetical protein